MVLDTFGKRIGIGFAIITTFLILAVTSSLSSVSENIRVVSRVNEERSPVVYSSLLLLNGVNQSISAIRGWSLYHDPESKKSRADAWSDIDGALSKLTDIGSKAGVKIGDRVSKLRESLNKLKNTQDKIEEKNRITNSDIQEMQNELVPLGREIRAQVESLVDEQNSALRSDAELATKGLRSLTVMEWVFLLLGLLVAGLTGTLITRGTTKSIAAAVDSARRISEQDFSFEVNLKGPKEIEVFSQSLEKMRQNLKNLTEGLRRNNEVLTEQKWQIDGQAGLLERIAGDQKISELAKNVLDFVCTRTSSLVGVFYKLEGNILLPAASFAHHGASESSTHKFSLNEGLVGQAVADQRPVLVDNVPGDYIRVVSGTGEAKPRSLAVIPLVHDNIALGAFEVANFAEFSEAQIEFLKKSAPNIAIAMNLSISNQKTKELLEETQAQAEELQAQQEELRAANEELETKTESLEASEEELRSQQEQLKSTNEELEEQTLLLEREKEALAQRTLELEKTKSVLESRAREVEQVSRYKSDFLANMSHELRTPLNSILMLSQSLGENRTGSLSDRQLNAVKTIHSSGADLLTLIEDILDLSKVEAGKLEIRPEAVSIKELCDTMQAYFEPMSKETGLDYKIQLGQNIPETILTDSTRVKQILKNLLSNAFKFTNEGSVSLSIFRPDEAASFELTRRNIPSLCFSVKDTGIGVPADQIQAVFEAFKQLDAKTTRKYGGTGLGLSIVRELVALLGGEIKIESTEGVGTNICVCLPEVLVMAASIPSQTETTTAAPAFKNRNGEESVAVSQPIIERLKLKMSDDVVSSIIQDDRDTLKVADSVILIVEDDMRFANSLLELCRDRGFKGIILNDGVSAVKLAEEIIPSGILLDLSLPELDGSDVLRLLKENPKTRHIPVQVITGHDRKHEVMNEGAIGFLKKPVTVEELSDVLKKMRDFSATERKLLIVEDDAAQRSAIREWVQVPGISIIETETGAAGLAELKKGGISCVILDLRLPDMNGREFLKLANELGTGRMPPVIIYTGKDLSDSEVKELEKGAQSIIVKSAKSPERLFDETMMFLHRLQKDLPPEKRRLVESLHDPTRILKDKSVLVVDDDPRNIQSLTHLLEDHGMLVREAENGKAALEHLENSEPVDIVLMDMMMPEMDGYEATRRLRRTPKFKNIPVVALTARAMKGERERCLEAGCDDYLSKPIENDKLISLLRVWLYRSV